MKRASKQAELNPKRVRFTFHLHKAVLEKLRDVVAFKQSKKSSKYGLHDPGATLSEFVENEVVRAIERLESGIHTRVPSRQEEVHFGRPLLRHKPKGSGTCA